MARKQEPVVPVSAEDIAYSLAAIRKDTGCEGRITIALVAGSDTDLRVVVETYTDHGTRVGVAREIDVYRPRPSHGLMGYLMCALHRIYHRTCQEAHRGL